MVKIDEKDVLRKPVGMVPLETIVKKFRTNALTLLNTGKEHIKHVREKFLEQYNQYIGSLATVRIGVDPSAAKTKQKIKISRIQHPVILGSIAEANIALYVTAEEPNLKIRKIIGAVVGRREVSAEHIEEPFVVRYRTMLITEYEKTSDQTLESQLDKLIQMRPNEYHTALYQFIKARNEFNRTIKSSPGDAKAYTPKHRELKAAMESLLKTNGIEKSKKSQLPNVYYDALAGNISYFSPKHQERILSVLKRKVRDAAGKPIYTDERIFNLQPGEKEKLAYLTLVAKSPPDKGGVPNEALLNQFKDKFKGKQLTYSKSGFTLKEEVTNTSSSNIWGKQID